MSVNSRRVQTYFKASIVNASGDTVLIAAPTAPSCIVVTGFTLQNESATATTMQLKDGAGNVYKRVLGQNQGEGMVWQPAPGVVMKLSPGTALILNLSGANQCGYSVEWQYEAAD
jgi:hypothetical protein